MFWKKRTNPLKTVTFRLTLWYLLVFSTLSMAVFMAVYLSLVLRLQDQKDSELLDESMEFESIYREQGIRALQEEFTHEAELRGTGQVFFQLLSPRGESLAASDLSQWADIGPARPDFPTAQGRKPAHRTLSPEGREYKVRLLVMPVGGAMRLRVASSLQPEEAILERYRETFGAALLAMVCGGGLFGFLLARKAMSGVQRVTETSTAIGRNDLGRRVPVAAGEGEEIKALARAFNGMLERIEVLLDEFRQITDNVAHELRTPVTRIRGRVETTLSSPGDLNDYREMGVSVIEGCDDLIEMIGTMLEIAKADSGTIELDPVPLDLSGLAEEAVDLFSPMAEDKGIEIRLVRSCTAQIIGDRRKIQRVVANLLDNAVKYTPAGGVITVTVDTQEKNGRVAISDTGIGIPKKDIPHVFERFYRCDKSRSTQGTGLGLSLAMAVIKAHGGRMTAESTGQGSTFAFTLPSSPQD